MERTAFETDLDRQSKLLSNKYIRLKQNHPYNISIEGIDWQKESLKNRYCPDVNINNWVEERCDINYLRSKRATLIQETSRTSAKADDYAKYQMLPKIRVPTAFPGHQPQLDSKQMKKVYNSFETATRVAFQDPKLITRKSKNQCKHCG